VSSAPIAVRAHRAASRIAIGLAVLGAVILLGAAVIVSFSVLLRTLVAGQVRGDFEIMAVSSGIAILLFLPYCQSSRSHVLIEVFTTWLPARAVQFLDALWMFAVAAAAAFLTWRLSIGLEEAWSGSRVTMIRHIPLAIVFLASVVGVAGTSLVALLELLSVLFANGRRDGDRG
jgi:TRAP-type C4-dicarboxylate transport system permease small subunit